MRVNSPGTTKHGKKYRTYRGVTENINCISDWMKGAIVVVNNQDNTNFPTIIGSQGFVHLIFALISSVISWYVIIPIKRFLS